MADFKAKMHQNRFRLGLQTPLGELTALTLAVFKGPTSKGKEGEGEHSRAAVGMGIPIGMGMVWVWGL